ncbi:MAG: hypothetical protein ACYDH9_18520 [Limisphaerales bacterium]
MINSTILALSPIMVIHNRITNQIVPPAIPLEELAAETEICPKENLPPVQAIWRYLAVDKFLDLITSRKLYLARLDRFDDGLEGLWSNGNQHRRTRAWEAYHSAYNINADSLQMALQCLPQRLRYFASCWHINDREDRGMWRRYAPRAESVLIKSRAAVLQSCGARWQGVTGKVGYVCHDDPRPEFLSYAPAYYKPLEYRFEREFRLAVPWPHQGIQPPEFLKLPLDPGLLIEEMIIHPHAGDSFGSYIRTVARRHIPIAKVSRPRIASRLW